MPIPALTFPESMAIGIPIGLVGYAAQEMMLRRRAVKRGPGPVVETLPEAPQEVSQAGNVTAGDMASATPALPDAAVASAPTAKPVRRARTTSPAARPRTAAVLTKAAVDTVAGATAKPHPGAAATAAATAAAKTTPEAPPTARASRTKTTPGAAPARPPARRAPSLDTLKRKRAALERGLDAVIEFVDGPARRAPATACADALLLAVPKTERGPHIEAYLHAAGAKEAPGRLQEMAEDAGMELAAAIKAVGAEIKARSGA